MNIDKDVESTEAMARDKAISTGIQADALQQERSQRMLELDEKNLGLRTELLNEQLQDMQDARRARRIVARLAIGIPVFMLALLLLGLIFPAIFGGFLHNDQTDMWPKVVLISGTFLTFIFIFGALVRGVFASAPGGSEEQRPEQLVGSATRHAGS